MQWNYLKCYILICSFLEKLNDELVRLGGTVRPLDEKARNTQNSFQKKNKQECNWGQTQRRLNVMFCVETVCSSRTWNWKGIRVPRVGKELGGSWWTKSAVKGRRHETQSWSAPLSSTCCWFCFLSWAISAGWNLECFVCSAVYRSYCSMWASLWCYLHLLSIALYSFIHFCNGSNWQNAFAVTNKGTVSAGLCTTQAMWPHRAANFRVRHFRGNYILPKLLLPHFLVINFIAKMHQIRP